MSQNQPDHVTSFLDTIERNPFVSETYRATLRRRLLPSQEAPSPLPSISSWIPASHHSSSRGRAGHYHDRPGDVQRQIRYGSESPPPDHHPSSPPTRRQRPPPTSNPYFSIHSYLDPMADEPIKPNTNVLGGPLSEGVLGEFANEIINLHLSQLLEQEQHDRSILERSALSVIESETSDSRRLEMIDIGIDIAERIEETTGRRLLLAEESRRRGIFWNRFNAEGFDKVRRWAAWRIDRIVEGHWRASMGEWMAEATMRAEYASRLVLVEWWWGECVLNPESDLHTQFMGGKMLVAGMERRRRLQTINNVLEAGTQASEQNGQLLLLGSQPNSPNHLHPLHRADLVAERDYLLQNDSTAAQEGNSLSPIRRGGSVDGASMGSQSPLREMLWYYSQGNSEMLQAGRADREQDSPFYPDTTAARREIEEDKGDQRRRTAMEDLWRNHHTDRLQKRLLSACSASRRRIQWEEDGAMETLLQLHHEEWSRLRQYLLAVGTERRRKSPSASPFQPWEQRTDSPGSPKAMDLVRGMFAGFAIRQGPASPRL